MLISESVFGGVRTVLGINGALEPIYKGKPRLFKIQSAKRNVESENTYEGEIV